jgi:hypothetical protein
MLFSGQRFTDGNGKEPMQDHLTRRPIRQAVANDGSYGIRECYRIGCGLG